MNANGLPMAPIEVHLNSCALEVVEVEQDGQKMRQLRVVHQSGLPVVLVMTLPELSAINVGRQLAGERIVLADSLPLQGG